MKAPSDQSAVIIEQYDIAVIKSRSIDAENHKSGFEQLEELLPKLEHLATEGNRQALIRVVVHYNHPFNEESRQKWKYWMAKGVEAEIPECLIGMISCKAQRGGRPEYNIEEDTVGANTLLQKLYELAKSDPGLTETINRQVLPELRRFYRNREELDYLFPSINENKAKNETIQSSSSSFFKPSAPTPVNPAAPSSAGNDAAVDPKKKNTPGA